MIRSRQRGVGILALAAWVLVTTWLIHGSSHGAHAAPTDTPATNTGQPFYDFKAENPPCGFCETKVFRRPPDKGSAAACTPGKRIIAEPINVVFALPTIALGLLGIFRSKRTAMAYQFLYGLLVSYGIFSAIFHVAMTNGFYRMKDVALSLLQSFVVIMLAHSVYLYHLKRSRQPRRIYRLIVVVMTLIFTAYPAAVHVAGESSASPVVAWAVFDVLWLVVVAQILIIWRRRHTWPHTPSDAAAFRFGWYAIGGTAIAYGCWCLDKFLCDAKSPVFAYLLMHGWWHLFIGLAMYYLIAVSRYFGAHEYGLEPFVEYLPARGRVRLAFVEWRPRH